MMYSPAGSPRVYAISKLRSVESFDPPRSSRNRLNVFPARFEYPTGRSSSGDLVQRSISISTLSGQLISTIMSPADFTASFFDSSFLGLCGRTMNSSAKTMSILKTTSPKIVFDAREILNLKSFIFFSLERKREQCFSELPHTVTDQHSDEDEPHGQAEPDRRRDKRDHKSRERHGSAFIECQWVKCAECGNDPNGRVVHLHQNADR